MLSQANFLLYFIETRITTMINTIKYEMLKKSCSKKVLLNDT